MTEATNEKPYVVDGVFTLPKGVHVNPNVGAQACHKPNDCMWGGPEEHFATREEAEALYEQWMGAYKWTRFNRVQDLNTGKWKHVMTYVTPNH